MKGVNNQARSIFGIFGRRRIVVLRTFVKKTQKIPARELEVILKREKEFTDAYILQEV